MPTQTRTSQVIEDERAEREKEHAAGLKKLFELDRDRKMIIAKARLNLLDKDAAAKAKAANLAERNAVSDEVFLLELTIEDLGEELKTAS